MGIRQDLKELRRRLRVAAALLWGPHPEQLPHPEPGPITPAERQEIAELESLALILGPYRNLTTLTAAILFLHPNCQVLNHAGPRMLDDESLNFLQDYSDEKYQRFCHWAITVSQGGARGGYGGSILLAHAFAEHEDMFAVYRRRYGGRTRKRRIRSLVWKESERVNQFIQEQEINLPDLLRANDKLRFLMPIRRPLDTAASIHRIGMHKFYGLPPESSLLEVLEPVLEELAWFVDLAGEFPGRFHYFYQDQFDRQALVQLASFLGLPPDERWIRDSLSVYNLRPTKAYAPDVRQAYQQRVEHYFAGHPQVKARLLAMAAVGESSLPTNESPS